MLFILFTFLDRGNLKIVRLNLRVDEFFHDVLRCSDGRPTGLQNSHVIL